MLKKKIVGKPRGGGSIAGGGNHLEVSWLTCPMIDVGCQLEPHQGCHQNTYLWPPSVAWAS